MTYHVEVEFVAYRPTNRRKCLSLHHLAIFLCALQTAYSGLHVGRLDPRPARLSSDNALSVASVSDVATYFWPLGTRFIFHSQVNDHGIPFHRKQ